MTEPERCHYCPAPATTQDHIVPRSRYGLTRAWNLTPACQPCNRRKGSAMPTCPCVRCQVAVSRWRQGERAKYTPAERRALQARSETVPEALPPELVCLSPAMRALLLNRRRKS